MTSSLTLRGVVFSIVLALAGCGGDSSSPSAHSTPTSGPSAHATPASGGSFAPAASNPSMNQARSDATATLLNNGKVLIAGGLDSNHPLPINSVELYDPSSWSYPVSVEARGRFSAEHVYGRLREVAGVFSVL